MAAISGNQKAITPAKSGLLRSGAGRSGWPVSVGRRVPLYALSNVARSNATRSNYHSPSGFVSIGGVHVGTKPTTKDQKIVGNIQITDVLNETPNRLTFRVRGVVPLVGQDVIVTGGSINTLERLFAGQVLNVSHAYIGTPALAVFDVNAIDWTWSLNQRLVSQRWFTTSATAIAADILAAGAPGYSGVYIAANLTVLDEFTVTDQTVSQALTQLAKRIGGYWHVDYFKRLHLYTDADPDAGTDPRPLNPVHATLYDLVIDKDGGQLVTRMLVEGGGSTALATVVPGETLIPVVTASWYETGGGQVKSGPQRITYGGVALGGTGTLVGPGASPSVAASAQAIAGSGVEPGRHEYAIAFVTSTTGQGERSLVGPRTPVVVGTIGPPVAALTGGPILAGAGPDPGWHYWSVTFVTAAGETLPGPPLVYTVPAGVDVLAAPTPQAPMSGGSIEPGTFYYGVTFGTSSGESTLGPASGPVTLTGATIANAPAPSILSNGPNSGQGNMAVGDTYDYAVAWSTAAGQTDHTKETAVTVASNQANATASTSGGGKSSTMTVAIPYAASAAVTWVHVYRRNFSRSQPNVSSFRLLSSHANVPGGGSFQIGDLAADSAIAGNAAPRTDNTATVNAPTAVPLAAIPTGPAGVTARHLYRSNGGPFRKLATLNNNSATTYNDTTATASLGAEPPTVNTSAPSRVTLNNLPIGGPDVTSRRIYRSKANTASPLQLAVTVNDNTTTSVIDTVTDAALGVAAPAASTATAGRVQLTNLPIGPSSVTGRLIYRTAADQTGLQLLAYVTDNTTSTYIDAASDTTLGGPPSDIDTSGLQQPAGLVNAGSPVLIVAGGAAAFRPGGGWAVIGNGQQVIRYTGLSANALIGIPQSGPGAITAAISYNSTVTAAPMLVGVPASGAGAVRYAIKPGDDVNLWIQVDDPTAQAAVAAVFGTSGIIEDVIQDRRLSATESRARGRAHLAARKDVLIRVRYKSRDMNTRSGRTVTVNLLAWPYQLSAEFTIQSVTISNFTPSIYPTFDVEASSERFTFEDLLRRIGTRPDPTG